MDAQQIEDNERGLEVVGMLRAWWHGIASSGGNQLGSSGFQAVSERGDECDRSLQIYRWSSRNNRLKFMESMEHTSNR